MNEQATGRIAVVDIRRGAIGGRVVLDIPPQETNAVTDTPRTLSDFKYLNQECSLSGCQWLVAQHQVDVYRKQMADMLAFVQECANDRDDRVSPGIKAKARRLLEADISTPAHTARTA